MLIFSCWVMSFVGNTPRTVCLIVLAFLCGFEASAGCLAKGLAAVAVGRVGQLYGPRDEASASGLDEGNLFLKVLATLTAVIAGRLEVL